MTITIDRIEDCPLIYWSELTPDQQADFDYLDTDERQESANFVLYRDNVYDVGEFMLPISAGMFPTYWHGYHSDSFFSGVLIHLTDDAGATLATYYS